MAGGGSPMLLVGHEEGYLVGDVVVVGVGPADVALHGHAIGAPDAVCGVALEAGSVGPAHDLGQPAAVDACQEVRPHVHGHCGGKVHGSRVVLEGVVEAIAPVGRFRVALGGATGLEEGVRGLVETHDVVVGNGREPPRDERLAVRHAIAAVLHGLDHGHGQHLAGERPRHLRSPVDLGGGIELLVHGLGLRLPELLVLVLELPRHLAVPHLTLVLPSPHTDTTQPKVDGHPKTSPSAMGCLPAQACSTARELPTYAPPSGVLFR